MAKCEMIGLEDRQCYRGVPTVHILYSGRIKDLISGTYSPSAQPWYRSTARGIISRHPRAPNKGGKMNRKGFPPSGYLYTHASRPQIIRLERRKIGLAFGGGRRGIARWISPLNTRTGVPQRLFPQLGRGGSPFRFGDIVSLGWV